MSCNMPLTPEQPTEAIDVTALGIALDEENQFAFLKDEELCEWKWFWVEVILSGSMPNIC